MRIVGKSFKTFLALFNHNQFNQFNLFNHLAGQKLLETVQQTTGLKVNKSSKRD